jgi:putative membrane protein
MMDWTMGLMWIWPVLIVAGLAAVGYATVALVRQRSPQHGSDAGGVSSARRILDERYARGEINDDEYRRARTELS